MIGRVSLSLGAALAFSCLLGFPHTASAIEPYRAQAIQPYRAQAVRPYRAAPVKPYHAAPVRRDRAAAVRPYSAAPVKPYRAGSVRVHTEAERRQMMDNTRRAYPRSRGHGGGGGTIPGCPPNCGFDYSRGQNAPTLYNPNYNYSPFGH